MIINYLDKLNDKDHLIIISSGANKVTSDNFLEKDSENLLNDFIDANKSEKELIETFFSSSGKSKSKISSFTYARFDYKKDFSSQQSFFSKLLSYIERKKLKNIAILLDNVSLSKFDIKFEIYENLLIGFKLKDYGLKSTRNFQKRILRLKKLHY